MTCNLLFVYGTLRRDSTHSMAAFLANRATYLRDASVRGQLFHFDTYPGMRTADSSTDLVYGEIFELHEVETTLVELDKYEACDEGLFRRELVAFVSDDQEGQAWTYFYVGPESGRRIESGDYRPKLIKQSLWPKL